MPNNAGRLIATESGGAGPSSRRRCQDRAGANLQVVKRATLFGEDNFLLKYVSWLADQGKISWTAP
jgi:hypothetical protein